MAEQAQLHLEARLPDLEELARRGLFSDARIREIVIQRKKHEYRLKRRTVRLDDFLSYIDFEKQLEVESRDSSLGRTSKERHFPGNYSLIQHVYQLYQRALARYSGNTALWMQFLTYSMLQGGRSIFKKNVAKALQVHPRHAPLWLLSARFEWASNGNMQTARTVLQHATRLDPANIALWHGFFDMEVDFAVKILERQKLLEITSQADDHEVDRTDQVLRGGIAMLVMRQAISNVPTLSPADAAHFLQVSLGESQNLPHLVDDVFENLSEFYANQPTYLTVFIETLSSDASFLDLPRVLKLMNNCTLPKTCPNLLKACIGFLESARNRSDSNTQNDVVIAINDKIDQLLQLAAEKGVLTNDLYSTWIRLASSLGYSNSEVDCLVRSGGINHILGGVNSASTSENRIELLDPRLFDTALNALKELKCSEERGKAAEMLLSRCCESTSDDISEKLTLALERLLTDADIPTPRNFPSSIRKLASIKGVDFCRKLISKIPKARSVNWYFYKGWVALENCDSPVNAALVRRLFREALIVDPQNEETYAASIRFERSQNNYSVAAHLLDQALKIVPSPELFIRNLDS